MPANADSLVATEPQLPTRTELLLLLLLLLLLFFDSGAQYREVAVVQMYCRPSLFCGRHP